MKFRLILILFLIIPLVEAYPIYVKPLSDSELQPETAFNYNFTFVENYDCTGQIFSAQSIITTGVDGIGFVDISLRNITTAPSYLCEYKAGALRTVHNFSDQIFANVFAQSINATNLFVFNTANFYGDIYSNATIYTNILNTTIIYADMINTSVLNVTQIYADTINVSTITGLSIGNTSAEIWAVINNQTFVLISEKPIFDSTFNGTYNLNTTGNMSADYGFFDGRVGIGTTNPQRELHIAGPTTWLRLDRHSSSYGSAVLFVRSDTAISAVESSWLFGPTNTAGATGDDFVIIDYGTAVSGATGDVRLLIDKATGNVGIGTTSPSHKLNVIGDANITETLYSGNINASNITTTGFIVRGNKICNETVCFTLQELNATSIDTDTWNNTDDIWLVVNNKTFSLISEKPIFDATFNNSFGGGNSSFNESFTDTKYVPYTGATGNVDLGTHTLTAEQLTSTDDIYFDFYKLWEYWEYKI